MRRLVKLLMAFALVLLSAGVTAAATISVESGGITLLGANTSTQGTFDAPWIIEETMTGAGTLEFSSAPLVGDNVDCWGQGGNDDACTGHNQSKWISKTITNNTQFAWTWFRLELPYIPHVDQFGAPSDDTLSFASAALSPPVFTSTVFTAYTVGTFDTWGDYLTFYGNIVAPLDSVTFKFVITTNFVDNDPFSLRQMSVPEPSTLALLGAGLALLGLRRRLWS